MPQTVYIVGSKGIPAKYGGFETFVEKLTEHQKDTEDLFGNYIISWLMMPQINSALNSNRFLRLR